MASDLADGFDDVQAAVAATVASAGDEWCDGESSENELLDELDEAVEKYDPFVAFDEATFGLEAVSFEFCVFLFFLRCLGPFYYIR